MRVRVGEGVAEGRMEGRGVSGRMRRGRIGQREAEEEGKGTANIFGNQQIHQKTLIVRRRYTQIPISHPHDSVKKTKHQLWRWLGARDGKIPSIIIYTFANMGANMGPNGDHFSGYRAFHKFRT